MVRDRSNSSKAPTDLPCVKSRRRIHRSIIEGCDCHLRRHFVSRPATINLFSHYPRNGSVDKQKIRNPKEISNHRNVFNMLYVAATRAREKLLIIQLDDSVGRNRVRTHSSRRGNVNIENYDPNCCPVTKALTFCAFDEPSARSPPSVFSILVVFFCRQWDQVFSVLVHP